MTDQNSSGASLAPAADTQAPAASAQTPAVSFGSTRGSGLARGKRQSSASAPTANTAKSDYKPIALEVITPASEYKNPFASPEPATAPAEEPAKIETPAATAAAVSEPEPVAAQADPVAEEPAAEEPAERREIQILPPAEAIRPSVSWESSSPAPRHDERPTFRPDRREDAANGAAADPAAQRPDSRGPRSDSFQRQPRDPRELRQPRDPREARQPRDPRDERQPRDRRFDRQPRDPRDEEQREDSRPQRAHEAPAPRAEAAPKGFFAWIKSLFGGSKPAEVPAAPREFGGERSGDGQRHRRRHRGGRGHGGNPQGFRGERSFQGGPRQDGPRPDGPRHDGAGGEGENRGGDRQGGPRRRRHRGGSGRGRGGEHRSEGQQGGGAI
jgi:hypothetical protein